MRKTFAMLMAIILIFGAVLSIQMPMAYADPFRSIEKEIQYAFIPYDLQEDVDAPITRVEFCRVIVDLYEYLVSKSTDNDVEPIEFPKTNPFVDTKDSAVLKAYSLGVIEPDSSGRFHPKDKLTIQEKAVMLYNLLLVLNPDIDDVVKHDPDFADEEEVGLWAMEALSYLNKNGIILTDDDDEINPDDTVTRGDTIDIVDRFVEHKLALDGTMKGIEKELKYDLIPDDLEEDTSRYITREQYCQVVLEVYEQLTGKSADEIKTPAKSPFTDTRNPYVLKANALGIVSGVGNKKFNPKEKLTLEEKAVMLYNTLTLIDPSIEEDMGEELNCDDADEISSWALKAIKYLSKHNIIVDDENNELNPDDNVRIDDSNEITDRAVKHHTDDEDGPANYLLYGYHVIKKGPINSGDINMRAPILDQELLEATDYVKTNKHTASDIIDTVSNTVSDFYKELNASAKVEYDGVLYSGSVNADYGLTNKMTKEQVLIKHVELHPVSEIILQCQNSQIKKLLSKDFKEDIKRLSPEKLFDKYGTHLIARYALGGRLELNYNFNNVDKMSESDITIAAKASYGNTSGEVDTHTKQVSKKLVSNSKLIFKGIGGDGITGNSVEQLNDQYAEWVKSLDSKPEICYVYDFKNSMVPIWELVDDEDIAKALSDEFDSYVADAESMISNLNFDHSKDSVSFITDIIVASDKNKNNALKKIPPNYKVVCINAKTDDDDDAEHLDANKGAGGDFIYIGYLMGNEEAKAIRNIKVTKGGVDGYKKVDMDLNKNAGGDYIYLNYTRNGSEDSHITAISGYYGKHYSIPFGWEALSSTMDMNKGAGGDYVYLIIKR